MLNLDETLATKSNYVAQRDFYLKFFLYSIGVFVFIEILRAQIAEINLLQLVPGFYLVLLFSSLIFLVLLSDLIFRFPMEFDNAKEMGVKTLKKLQLSIFLRLSFLFFFVMFFLASTTILPLSLDSFNFYTENTLENFWSFDEVISLESVLLILILIFSQLPSVITSYLANENDINWFPKFWKINIFASIFLAGILTPTIDGYTQFSFAFFSIIFYLIILNIIEKRMNVKFNGLNSVS